MCLKLRIYLKKVRFFLLSLLIFISLCQINSILCNGARVKKVAVCREYFEASED